MDGWMDGWTNRQMNMHLQEKNASKGEYGKLSTVVVIPRRGYSGWDAGGSEYYLLLYNLWYLSNFELCNTYVKINSNIKTIFKKPVRYIHEWVAGKTNKS